jgi:hypothetical protein
MLMPKEDLTMNGSCVMQTEQVCVKLLQLNDIILDGGRRWRVVAVERSRFEPLGSASYRWVIKCCLADLPERGVGQTTWIELVTCGPDAAVPRYCRLVTDR